MPPPRRAAKRVGALAALTLAVAAVPIVALSSHVDEQSDASINRLVSYSEARHFKAGTWRAVVERSLGPGGGRGDHDFDEPVGTRCRYYTRRGPYAGEYVQLCYLRDRLATVRIAIDTRSEPYD